MESILIGAVVVVTGLVLVSLAVQLALHVSRWRRAPTRTEGDYRAAPREIEGAVAIRWEVVAVAVTASLWSICTYLFAAAGGLLALVTFGDHQRAGFVVILGVVILSGILHASIALRVASRLVRRHEGVERMATQSSIHGVLHHLVVLALFARWSWVEGHHDFEEAMLFLLPICALGVIVSGLVHVAGRRAAPSSRDQLISAAII